MMLPVTVAVRLALDAEDRVSYSRGLPQAFSRFPDLSRGVEVECHPLIRRCRCVDWEGWTEWIHRRMFDVAMGAMGDRCTPSPYGKTAHATFGRA